MSPRLNPFHIRAVFNLVKKVKQGFSWVLIPFISGQYSIYKLSNNRQYTIGVLIPFISGQYSI